MSTPVSLPADQNFIRVAGGVLDDGSGTIAPLSIQASTGRLKVTATIIGGSGYQAPLSGGLTGTNTWTTAPNAICVDGVTYQKVSQGGTTNWSGTTTTILSFTPTDSVFAVA